MVGEGAGGIGLRTDDGAQTWSLLLETAGGINDVCFVDSLTGWAVGSDGTVEATRDGGRTWRGIDVDPYRDFNGVCFVDERNGWIVGHLESIVHTADGGTTWSWQSEGLEFALLRVVFLDTLDGWAIGFGYGGGEHGLILRTQDGGETWSIQEVTPEVLFSVHFRDNRHGWITGSSVIYWTEDAGETWTRAVIDSLVTTVNDVAFVSNQTGWAVGYFGRVWQTEDGGRTWQYVDSFGSGYALRHFQAIDFSDPYNAWIVGSSGFVGHMRRVPVYEP